LSKFGSTAKNTLPNYHFELVSTAQKFEFAAPAYGEIYQLSASLAFLEDIGVPRIED
jgi:selenocysteine lyase/cysteine desulfurase